MTDLEPGIYETEVISTEKAISAETGKDTIKQFLKVKDENGNEHVLVNNIINETGE